MKTTPRAPKICEPVNVPRGEDFGEVNITGDPEIVTASEPSSSRLSASDKESR